MIAEWPTQCQVWRGRGGLPEIVYDIEPKRSIFTLIGQIDMEEIFSTSNIQRGLRGILMLNGQLSILLLHHLDQ